MVGGKIIEINKDNFQQEVMQSSLPVLVDFWAPWCGPCRTVAPILEEISEVVIDKVKIAKLNVDDDGELASSFRIMSIPTMMLFVKGEMKEKIIGAKTKAEIEELLQKYIESK